MINFSTNSFNPLANFKVSVKNTENKNTNSSINSNQSTTNSSVNLKTNLASTATQSTNSNSNEVLGYKVDKDGYFTEEFNNAAGIPNDYKIHSSTMESFAKMKTNKNNILRTFRSVDIAKSIGNAYKILSQVVGEDILNSKSSFSKDDIAKFPQGYEYNAQTLQVLKVYDTIFEQNNALQRFDSKQALKNRVYISDLFYNATGTKPATDIFNNAYGGKESTEIAGSQWATTASKYTNADGTISKGGLLIGVLNNNLHTTEGEASTNGKKQGYDKTMSYADMMNFKGENGEWFVNLDVSQPLSFGDDEAFLTKSAGKKKLQDDYKSPLMQMLENLLAFQKEQAQKALKKRLDNATKVDIKA